MQSIAEKKTKAATTYILSPGIRANKGATTYKVLKEAMLSPYAAQLLHTEFPPGVLQNLAW